jgi:hypothetical protein
MKKQLSALFALGLLMATASAYAQTIRVKAEIPFNFVVTAGTLPSAEYTIQSVQNIDHLLTLSSAGQKSIVFLANPCLLLKATEVSGESKLVFRRYGDQYFLSEIWMEGSSVGYQLRKSRRELEMAQNHTVDSVVILAELR